MDKILEQYKCVHCGNNPVPHFLNWYNESLAILLAPLRQRLLYNPLTAWLKRRGTGQKFFLAAVRFLESIRVIRRQPRLELCKVPRAKVLWEEAEKRGIKMEELLLFGKPFDAYVAEKARSAQGTGDRKAFTLNPAPSTLVFSGLPRPTGYHSSVLDAMDDKWFLKKLFLKHGLPVPAGGCATNFWQAKKIFCRVQKPVIVKPRTGSRGRHSTTFVRTEQDLKQAFKAAKQLCFWAVVEEQLDGPVYRATLVDFKLAGVLRGDPPQVRGDGVSTITQLIEQKNSLPHPGVHPVKSAGGGSRQVGTFNRVKDIVISKQTELFLSRQGLALSSIPQKDQTVCLSEKIGVNYGGSSSEDLDACHPDNKELFVRAAKAVGDPVVGFDFIIPDITKSYREQRCGFIEANSLPFINLHHDPLLGRPQNVAAAVWEMIGW